MTKLLDIIVPNIGNYSLVNVAEVCVKVGDTVKKDDSLITLETDKATMDVPSPFVGTIREVLVKSGSQVKEGDLIFRIDSVSTETTKVDDATDKIDSGTGKTDNVKKPDKQSKNEENKSPKKSIEINSSDITSGEIVPSITTNVDHIDEVSFSDAFASPSIRKLARELGADLGKIVGSGAKGRITEVDVKSYVKGILTVGGGQTQFMSATDSGGLNLLPWPVVDFAQFGEIELKPLSRIKKLSGANLARNWAMIPHVTQFDEADTTGLEEFRKQLNEEYKKSGTKITPLAFLIKACVFALKEFPEFNTSLENDNLVYKKYYNIGFAADTKNGLVVPVLKNADTLGIVQIAAQTSELAALARDGKLKPSDMQGGTFTISSLGGIGGTAFTPIINAPEVAILGVSKSSIKPMWNGKEFLPKLMLPLSLSYDHRVIDGALAAKFTSYLAKVLSDVRRLIL
jgi:pyruvate dehydrogenase E2 component (dihydrolipoamide acetyltransferase)